MLFMLIKHLQLIFEMREVDNYSHFILKEIYLCIIIENRWADVNMGGKHGMGGKIRWKVNILNLNKPNMIMNKSIMKIEKLAIYKNYKG